MFGIDLILIIFLIIVILILLFQLFKKVKELAERTIAYNQIKDRYSGIIDLIFMIIHPILFLKLIFMPKVLEDHSNCSVFILFP